MWRIFVFWVIVATPAVAQQFTTIDQLNGNSIDFDLPIELDVQGNGGFVIEDGFTTIQNDWTGNGQFAPIAERGPEYLLGPLAEYGENYEAIDEQFELNVGSDDRKFRNQLAQFEGNYEAYNALIMLRRNPRDGMEGGQVPVPALSPIVQENISNSLTIAGPLKPAIQFGPCHRLSQHSLDDCFLPAVGLMFRDRDRSLDTRCSGTIIGPHHVLTAAHCVCEKPEFILVGTGSFGSQAFYRPTLADASVELANVANADTASAIISVTDVEMFDKDLLSKTYCSHGDIASIAEFEESDLAVVLTGNKIPFHSEMRAHLVNAPPQNGTFNIAGFGPDPSAQIQVKNLKRYLSVDMGSRQGAMLIVSGANGDSCRGDSGSGAYLRLNSGALGIFASLSNGRGQCAANSSSRYVGLDGDRLDWLRRTVSELDGPFFELLAEDAGTCLGWRCEATLPEL